MIEGNLEILKSLFLMVFDIGEVAERSKVLDWNSSNILTGVRGFESHPLRHPSVVLPQVKAAKPINRHHAETGAQAHAFASA
jgi:hypothetical protein